ncbi:hypothetical protein D9619_013683 [Psilocybe cf. subviscida]|uniref:Uncharacterized protein n=1 Tax=Psilocybe cf. subviscida TaxID=2480587 RepID=A0A8H5AZA7_9AGAR|nr:hypothetical protein D9619_013683 [Psilocybe cf. subviscida]
MVFSSLSFAGKASEGSRTVQWTIDLSEPRVVNGPEINMANGMRAGVALAVSEIPNLDISAPPALLHAGIPTLLCQRRYTICVNLLHHLMVWIGAWIRGPPAGRCREVRTSAQGRVSIEESLNGQEWVPVRMLQYRRRRCTQGPGAGSMFLGGLGYSSLLQRHHARYSYAKIIQIVVQSAALEACILTVNSTITFAAYILAQSQSNNLALSIVITQIVAYTAVCRIIVMGIAPTLIAVRVAEETPRTEVDARTRTSRISRLTFRRSAHRTDTDDGEQRTRISTMHFDSARRDDSVVSTVSEAGVDDAQLALGRNENTQNGYM